MGLNLVLLLVSLADFAAQQCGHFAQDHWISLASPNPGYQSGLAMLSFVVFAIFAYGGIEAVGGLVDKTEQPEKNFAKGIVIAAVVISVGYSLAICSVGRQRQLAAGIEQPFHVNLGNITYVLMTRLGATLANATASAARRVAAAGRIMVCAESPDFRHVPRLYRRVLYPELLAAERPSSRARRKRSGRHR